MPTLKIDEQEYDIDSLSEECKAQLISIRFVDSELRRLQAQASTLQTARMAYARALKVLLEEGAVSDSDDVKIEELGDNLKFD